MSSITFSRRSGDIFESTKPMLAVRRSGVITLRLKYVGSVPSVARAWRSVVGGPPPKTFVSARAGQRSACRQGRRSE
jgi:hypothetical protein